VGSEASTAKHTARAIRSSFTKKTAMTRHNNFKLEDGAVMVEPEVRKYFPTSEAVNKALRLLIEIIPAKRGAFGHRK